MISLVFIPVLLGIVFYIEFDKRDLKILKLNMPSVESCDESNFMFTFCADALYLNNESATFQIETMTKNEIEDKFKILADIRKDSLILKKMHSNFRKAIVFDINNNSNYGDFVNLLNNCEKYEFKLFGLDIWKNKFVVFEILNIPVEKYSECGTVMWNGIVHSPPAPPSISERVEAFYNKISQIFSKHKSFILLPIGYFLLIVFALKSRTCTNCCSKVLS